MFFRWSVPRIRVGIPWASRQPPCGVSEASHAESRRDSSGDHILRAVNTSVFHVKRWCSVSPGRRARRKPSTARRADNQNTGCLARGTPSRQPCLTGTSAPQLVRAAAEAVEEGPFSLPHRGGVRRNALIT